MTDHQDGSDGPDPAARNPRQHRLKQALRDNLKRRKSQIRERGKLTSRASADDEAALDDESGDDGEQA